MRDLRTNKNLKGIDQQRLNVLTIHFDHGKVVAVDGEDEARIARDRHETESVTVGTQYVNPGLRYSSRKTPTVSPF